jgi:hypothetical protein
MEDWVLTQLDGIGFWKRWLLDANVSTTDVLITEQARAISNEKVVMNRNLSATTKKEHACFTKHIRVLLSIKWCITKDILYWAYTTEYCWCIMEHTLLSIYYWVCITERMLMYTEYVLLSICWCITDHIPVIVELMGLQIMKKNVNVELISLLKQLRGM